MLYCVHKEALMNHTVKLKKKKAVQLLSWYSSYLSSSVAVLVASAPNSCRTFLNVQVPMILQQLQTETVVHWYKTKDLVFVTVGFLCMRWKCVNSTFISVLNLKIRIYLNYFHVWWLYLKKFTWTCTWLVSIFDVLLWKKY